MHLLDKIDQYGRTSPDRLAHVSGDQKLTYGALLTRSNSVAAWLDSQLGDKRVPVVVRGHKETEMIVSFIGAVKSGRPYVPIDYSMPEQRLEKVVEIAKAGLVLTPDKVAEITAAGNGNYQRKPLERDDPFYILFTSGSTGEPKGVIITLGNLDHFLEWMLDAYPLKQQSEIFQSGAVYVRSLSA